MIIIFLVLKKKKDKNEKNLLKKLKIKKNIKKE